MSGIRNLVFVFSRGISLADWLRHGLFDREKLIYEHHLASGRLHKVTWLTYGRDDRRVADALHREGRLHPAIEILPPPRFPLPRSIYGLVLPLLHARRLRDADVVKCMQMDGSWSSWLLARLIGARFYLRTGYTWSMQRQHCHAIKLAVFRGIETFMFRRADLASVTTIEQVSYLERFLDVSGLHVVPNPIDTELFSPAGDIGEDRLIFVGRLEAQKNLFAVIQASIQAGMGIDLVGAGADEAELRRISQGLDVRFLGMLGNRELPAVLCARRYFILGSHVEGLPKALLEAMSCGRECIVSDGPGLASLVRDGIEGTVARGTDAGALAEAIRIARSRSCGEAARRRILKDFSLGEVADCEWRILSAASAAHCQQRQRPHEESLDVSVLITVRNGGKHLAEAIGSVLGQHAPCIELVVVDDGSEDETWAIISAAAASDPRVIGVRSRAVGIARAANLGIRRCRGRYIARLDADDIAMPGRFILQATYLDCHPQAVCVAGAYREFTDDPRSSFPVGIRLRSAHAAICQALGCINPICHSTAMVRADALRHIGGYDESYPCSLDYDLWVRLARVGEIHQLPSVAALRRISLGMISLTRRRAQIWHSLRARLRHFVIHPPTPRCLWFVLRDLLRMIVPRTRSREVRTLTSA